MIIAVVSRISLEITNFIYMDCIIGNSYSRYFVHGKLWKGTQAIHSTRRRKERDTRANPQTAQWTMDH